MEVLNSIVSKITDYLVDTAVRHTRYMVCFDEIVEELEKENENLLLTQERVKNGITRAVRNTEKIENDVQKWLTDVSQSMEELQSLENELKRNKRCLNGWCPNLCWRYKLGKKMANKTLGITELLRNGKFVSVSHPATLVGVEEYLSIDYVPSESTKLALDQIMNALKDDSVNMIGLYGMGGVGKTTLAREVEKITKERKMFDQVVMAVVSEPPDIRKIQGQIADLLGLKFEEESEQGRARRLLLRLKDENVLIILDDVWKAIDLGSIGIPSGNDHKGCKILLTTRSEHVCVSMKSQKQIPVDVMVGDEAWSLFKKTTGGLDVDDVAKKVCEECKGSPLAIVTVAKAMKGKKSDNEWKAALRRLKSSVPVGIGRVGEDVYKCLKLSYDYLDGEESKHLFLLCSLFPEDYEIDLEDLTRFSVGLSLVQETFDTIEETRSQVHATINNLKASGLLLTTRQEGFVKMHDVVRDVALWIALKGDNKIFTRVGAGLTEWPKNESIDSYTAISLMANKITQLPDGLMCPKLEVLLFGENSFSSNLPNACFEGMRGLKVLDLRNDYKSLSSISSLPRSIQCLTSLKTLYLKYCNLADISILGKLKKLEILSFRGSDIQHLPDEIGELTNLRLLDLSKCSLLSRISSNVFFGLSQLEELYIGSRSFKGWEVEGTGMDTKNARLSQLNSLTNLIVLSLHVNNVNCLPRDLRLPNLQRYDIFMYEHILSPYPATKSLRISFANASLLNTFKKLFQGVKSLGLYELGEGCHSIIPDVDHEGLKELNDLVIRCCHEMEYLIDSVKWNPPAALLNLVDLFLYNMNSLREMCHGPPPTGFLQRLKKLQVVECGKLCSIFPAKLLQGLRMLEELIVKDCKEVKQVFELDGLHTEDENKMLLSSLKNLELTNLPELQFIWNCPAKIVSLHSLTILKVSDCNRLISIFSLSLAGSLQQLKCLVLNSCKLENIITEEDNEELSMDQIQPLCFPNLKTLWVFECKGLRSIFPISIARGLTQLEELTVYNNNKLEDIFGNGRDGEVGNGIDVLLPALVKLEFRRLPALRTFCPGYSMPPSLLELIVQNCPSMTTVWTSAKVMNVEECRKLCNIVPANLLRNLLNVEELTVASCYSLEEIFQLEELLNTGEHHEFLSTLKILQLRYLPELSSIWKGHHLQYVRLHSLVYIEVIRCDNLRHLFSPAIAQSLMQLESLMVSECKELERIIAEDKDLQVLVNDHRPPIHFPKLSKLEIHSCNKLKNLFSLTIARGLPQLSILEVKEAAELTEIFGPEHGAAVEDRKVIVIPELCYLKLENSPNLISFCPDGYQFVLPSLEDLEVYNCPKMTWKSTTAPESCRHFKTGTLQWLTMRNSSQLFHDVCRTQLMESLFSLQHLMLEKCEGVEEAFPPNGMLLHTKGKQVGADEMSLLSSLESIELKNLPELSCIWKCPSPTPIRLHKLLRLEVTCCKLLKHLFSHELACSMQQLKCLIIKQCEELEKIIEDDNGENPVCFPNLEVLVVEECNKLKNLFPVSIAYGLACLGVLQVRDAHQLEQIFGQVDGDSQDDRCEIILPLRWLSLVKLPSLFNFIAGNHFLLPFIHSLQVEKCPKLTTRFNLSLEDHACDDKEEVRTKTDDVYDNITRNLSFDSSQEHPSEIDSLSPPLDINVSVPKSSVDVQHQLPVDTSQPSPLMVNKDTPEEPLSSSEQYDSFFKDFEEFLNVTSLSNSTPQIPNKQDTDRAISFLKECLSSSPNLVSNQNMRDELFHALEVLMKSKESISHQQYASLQHLYNNFDEFIVKFPESNQDYITSFDQEVNERDNLVQQGRKYAATHHTFKQRFQELSEEEQTLRKKLQEIETEKTALNNDWKSLQMISEESKCKLFDKNLKVEAAERKKRKAEKKLARAVAAWNALKYAFGV